MKKTSKLTYAGLAFLAAIAAVTPLALYAHRQDETLGEFLKSSAITTDIKAKFFADSDIRSTKISVTTLNGIVTLAGTVDSSEQKQKALFIANQIRGVLSVIDNLVVKY